MGQKHLLIEKFPQHLVLSLPAASIPHRQEQTIPCVGVLVPCTARFRRVLSDRYGMLLVLKPSLICASSLAKKKKRF